jgi:hypothetical protein
MIELKDIKTEKLLEELAGRAGKNAIDAYLIRYFCEKVVEQLKGNTPPPTNTIYN